MEKWFGMLWNSADAIKKINYNVFKALLGHRVGESPLMVRLGKLLF